MGRIRSEQIGRGRGSDTGREYASVCWRAPAVGVVRKAGRPWWLRVTCADVYGSGMVSTATRQPACSLARAPEQRWRVTLVPARSEEHTSELQPLLRTSYTVFCLK